MTCRHVVTSAVVDVSVSRMLDITVAALAVFVTTGEQRRHELSAEISNNEEMRLRRRMAATMPGLGDHEDPATRLSIRGPHRQLDFPDCRQPATDVMSCLAAACGCRGQARSQSGGIFSRAAA